MSGIGNSGLMGRLAELSLAIRDGQGGNLRLPMDFPYLVDLVEAVLYRNGQPQIQVVSVALSHRGLVTLARFPWPVTETCTTGPTEFVSSRALDPPRVACLFRLDANSMAAYKGFMTSGRDSILEWSKCWNR